MEPLNPNPEALALAKAIRQNLLGYSVKDLEREMDRLIALMEGRPSPARIKIGDFPILSDEKTFADV